MQGIKKTKKYKVKNKILEYFLKEYWYIPSDVLQRGIEANIWNLCQFKKPVLDIGIGNGRMSRFIFKNIPRIDVGIDSDESGLRIAQKTKKYKKVLHADAQNLPFANESFNSIVSNSTFEHIDNDLKAVSESSRVLKRNGLFFITVPSNYLEKWIFEYEKKANVNIAKKNVLIFNKRTNHLHYRTLKNWQEIFEKNNLELLFYKYYFPKKVALFWYDLFKGFTRKILDREMWSFVGDSKLTKILPKKLLTSFLKNFVLKKMYKKGFFVESGVGAQLFLVARKV